MKNKILKLLFILTILQVSLVCISKVKAEPYSDDFKDYSFNVNVGLKNFNNVWEVELYWKTEQKIKYLDVNLYLENGHYEKIYHTGRQNLSVLECSEYDDYYAYTLSFTINSDDNLQGISLLLEYSFVDEFPQLSDLLYDKVVLSTGSTKQEESITIVGYIIIGLIISIVSAAATYIIVQKTKVEILKSSESGEEQDVYESSRN